MINKDFCSIPLWISVCSWRWVDFEPCCLLESLCFVDLKDVQDSRHPCIPKWHVFCVLPLLNCYMFSNFTIVWKFFLFFQLSDSKCLLHSLLKSLKICTQLSLVILLFLSFFLSLFFRCFFFFFSPRIYICQGFTIFCKQPWYRALWGILNIQTFSHVYCTFINHCTRIPFLPNQALPP